MSPPVIRRSLPEYLEMIDGHNGKRCRRMFAEHAEKMLSAPGSTANHQAWPGGYADHLRETMYFAEALYRMTERKLPFTLSDALLALFLHDLEKPWKHAGTEAEKAELASYPHYGDFILAKTAEYGIALSDEHRNALRYAHGEGNDYDPRIRVQWPLAAFIHVCDTMSARIFHEYPLPEDRSRRA